MEKFDSTLSIMLCAPSIYLNEIIWLNIVIKGT